jgi:hypothetical protein
MPPESFLVRTGSKPNIKTKQPNSDYKGLCRLYYIRQGKIKEGNSRFSAFLKGNLTFLAF